MDFNYGNSTITSSGAFIPSKKNVPLDARTMVDYFEEIKDIPNPYVGMEILVREDENNEGKRNIYVVNNLKPNALGIENSIIDMETLTTIPETLGIEDLIPEDGEIVFNGADTSGVIQPIEYQKIEDENLKTTDKTIVGAINELADKEVTIPSKVSELENDSEYVNKTELNEALDGIQTGNVNLSEYQKIEDENLETIDKTIVGAINELANKEVTIPSKVSELENDSEYVNKTELNEALDGIQTGNVDLSEYQKIEDENLKTTDKTIVGAINELVPKNLYTFLDAYVQWCKGEKFPIAFYGDSTIDGYNTTGYVGNSLGVDSTSPNTFCKVLEDLLKEECENVNLRIYNAGFTGKTLSWGVDNFEAEFGDGTAYSDVKMIGIGFGINDRLSFSTLLEYKNYVKEKVEILIDKCYKKGIQPFLITTQATNECGVQSDLTNFVLRDSYSINIGANEVKRELAKKYNIPLIDINKYTEKYLINSKENIDVILPDRLHFSDIGHKYEAGVIFAHLVPRVMMVKNKEEKLITYSSQNLKKAVPEDKLSYGGVYSKIYAQYDKGNTEDATIMDCYVFIEDKPSNLVSIKEGILNNITYVSIDGVVHDCPLEVTDLLELDLGLHHLVAKTGENNMVDFTGFGINDTLPRSGLFVNGLNYVDEMAFFEMSNDIVPTVLCIDYNSESESTSLSGKTITKIILPISTGGKITIGKCDMSLYGKGNHPVMIDGEEHTVIVGNNEISLDIELGEKETLCIGNVGDTALPYFAMSSGDRVPNIYEYTKIYTAPQFADSNEVSAIVLVCAIYVRE